MKRLLPAVLSMVLVACGGSASSSPTATLVRTLTPDPTPAPSLDLSHVHAMGFALEANVRSVEEADCDPGGKDIVANCYIGIASSSESEARRIVCDLVLPMVEERTSGLVKFVAFDVRNDDVIAPVDCGK